MFKLRISESVLYRNRPYKHKHLGAKEQDKGEFTTVPETLVIKVFKGRGRRSWPRH